MATALWGRDDTGIPVAIGRGGGKKPKQAKPPKPPKAPKERPSERISTKSIPRARRGVGRIALVVLLAIAIAAGGIAVGALTEVGPVVEAYVLGDTTPKPDPRIAALQTELERTRVELVNTETRTTELVEERKEMAKARAAAEARVEQLEAAAAGKTEETKSRSRSRSRDKDRDRDDDAKKSESKSDGKKSKSRSSRSSRR
jgi:hypothetical protein